MVLKCKEEYLSAVTEAKDKVNAVLEVTTRRKLWWKLLRGESCGGSCYEVKAVVEVTTRRTLLVGSTTR